MSNKRLVESRLPLTPAQWSIYEAGWDRKARFRVAVCGRRFGKALALETQLASPDGWTTMGKVTVGTRLFDEMGRICRVTYVTDVMINRPCNQIVFSDDSTIIADDDHLWQVSKSQRGLTALLTTKQIAEGMKNGETYRIASCRPLRDEGISGVARRHRRLRSLSTRNGQRMDDGTWRVFGDTVLLDDAYRLCLNLGLVPAYGSGPGGSFVQWHTACDACYRSIRVVTPTLSRPVKCIQVDSPSRLYLCGSSLIATHNTFLMAEELRRAARLAVSLKIGVENEIWYGAPTFIQAKRVMWSRLKRSIPRHWLSSKPNETSCSLRLISGHMIRLVGLDNSENLRGSGLWFFGGDEWADCRPSAWSEVVRPMLSTTGGHALFIGTPKGFDHFRDAYLLGQPGGDESYRSFLYTTAEGGNVPQDELEAAALQLDPRSFRQEYCASFETYAGRVVYAFSRADNVVPYKYNPTLPINIGMDFNVNPMSATVWQDDGEMVRQIGEIVLPTSNTDEMAHEITRRFGREGFEPGRKTVSHITIYPDPAGAQRRSSSGGRTDIGILRENGFVVAALRSHPPVRDRLNVMNRCFRSASGKVLATIDPHCTRSIEAYERLVFREGTNEPDKTQGFDHLVDASGYYLFSRNNTKVASVVSSFLER